jgi:capsular polysaccharide biosynthesis protein
MSEGQPEPHADEQPVRRRPVLVAALLLVVALLAIAGGFGAAAYNESRPKVFVASVVLIIDQEPALTQARDDGIISKLLRLRLKYADIVTTTSFADPLAAQLALSPATVHGALSAVAPPGSLLMTLSARADDPGVARTIATGAGTSLHDTLQRQQESLGVKPIDQVTLTVVTPARNGQQTAPRRSRSALLGVGVAVTILLLGVVLLDAARRRR